ncbi:MAG: hypothetical protein GX800_11580 [Clostridiaceae bacterium]|nr:hypothetical protein [Clostridiaceae bacterium]
MLAQLAFPGRFWLYTYQYLCGYEDLPELTVKFKQYLYEVIYLQEQCLENLENWLLESETE